MNKTSKGFTLIELIVVMIIISIVATYVSMRNPNTSSFDLNSALKNLMLDLRLTKTLSMSLNSNYRLVLSASSYQIKNEAEVPFFNVAADSTTTSILPLTISASTTIIFNSLGQPLDNSNNVINTVTTITITDGTNSRSIEIEPQTGFIHEQ
jgi:MSHA pilin protein MshC